MKLIKLITEEQHVHVCCKKVRHQLGTIISHTYTCGRNATHTNGSNFFCRHHSRMGRFVVRDGDVGEIIIRFDTEQELRDNIHLYPGKRIQKITKSSRRNL